MPDLPCPPPVTPKLPKIDFGPITGPGTAIRKAVGDAISGAINWLASALSKAYNDLVIMIVNLIVKLGLPSVKTIESDWYSIWLGGFFGLATKLVGLIAIIICLRFVLTPTLNHGRRLGRMFSNFALILLFGYLFYPLYSAALDFSQGVSRALISAATKTGSCGGASQTVAQLMQVIMPYNPFGMIGVSIFGCILGVILALEAAAMQVVMLLLLMFYPLVLSLRPLSEMTNKLFHVFNSAIITLFMSLPIMVFLYLLPLLSKNYSAYLGGGNILVMIMLSLLGGALAILTPVILAVLMFKSSQEMFGNVGADVSGKIDIGQMPTVTTQELNKSVGENRHSAITSFATGAAAMALGDRLGVSDDILKEVRGHLGKNHHGIGLSAGAAAHGVYKSRKKP